VQEQPPSVVTPAGWVFIFFCIGAGMIAEAIVSSAGDFYIDEKTADLSVILTTCYCGS
jgi:hypothetical protein